MKRRLVLLVLCALGAQVAAETPGGEQDRVATLAQAQAILHQKVQSQRARARTLALVLYRAARSLAARSWIMPAADRDPTVLRAAWRVLLRDLRELEVLELEEQRLVRAQQRGSETAVPAAQILPHSLISPTESGKVVAEFGLYKEEVSEAEIVRRGVELESKPGERIRAVAAGEVVYAGLLRGAGDSVLVAHGQGDQVFWSMTGRLSDLGVRVGDTVTAGQILGRASGDRVHLEIRIADLGPTTPVDPQPLLPERRRSR